MVKVNTQEMNHPDVSSHDRDSKGRIEARVLTDREIIEETLEHLRTIEDLVREFISGMEKNPVMRTMTGMFGKR